MKVLVGGHHPPPCPGPQAHTTRHGHPSCAGHVRNSNPAYNQPGKRVRIKGMPCPNAPARGGKVCAMHGGKSPRAKAAAIKNLTETAARKEMTKLGLPDPVKISSAEALIWAVSAKYAEVCWLRSMVQSIDPDDLIWGKTQDKTGGDDHGTTFEARANIWWVMLRTAEDQLVKFATAAHVAGVDDAMVDLAKARGQMLGVFLDGLMAALCAALVAAGVTRDDFPAVWAASIADLFPKHFRTLGEA